MSQLHIDLRIEEWMGGYLVWKEEKEEEASRVLALCKIAIHSISGGSGGSGILSFRQLRKRCTGDEG